MRECPVTCHVPVLVNEVLESFRACLTAGTIIDATVGGGGHSYALAREIAKVVPVSARHARLVGLDVDPQAIKVAAVKLKEFGCKVIENLDEGCFSIALSDLPLIILLRANYADLKKVVKKLGVKQVSGVLMDLGISSYHLEPQRGFSYEKEGPLDMRFDQGSSGPTALNIIHRTKQREMEIWLREYGDETMAKGISRRIYDARHRIKTTTDLAETVASAVPRRYLRKHLARVFQAFRIVVNDEIENLRKGLEAGIKVLIPGGRLAVICYQSGEDRCFKDVFRQYKDQVRLFSKKPIRPNAEEIMVNNKARSARLRVLVKLPVSSYKAWGQRCYEN